MNLQRNFYMVTFFFTTLIIWQIWKHNDYLHTKQYENPQQVNNSSKIQQLSNDSKQDKIILVKTDVLSLKINTCGGDIEVAELLSYPKTLNSSQNVVLLENNPQLLYQAQSSIIGPNTPETNEKPIIYQAAQDTFELSNNQKELRVPLTWKSENGVVYTKTFIFRRSQYAVDINYSINNITNDPITVSLLSQLKQTVPITQNANTNSLNLSSSSRIAYSTDHDKYKKYKINDVFKGNHLNTLTNNGWIAMLQKYFATAWIPHTEGNNILYTKYLNNGIAAVCCKSAPITIPAKSKQDLNATMWIGPAIQDQMANVAPYLDLTVDYGYLWFISQPLFKLLRYLNSFIGNWGISIILITLMLRCIMYPLTKAQYISMMKMRMLQPKIKLLRERAGNDQQKMSQDLINLYKKEQVNPLGGCLPLILQMPIFLALYYMLIGSVELRQAPFAFWIHDLSSQDPYYILPILMGITMIIIQRMSPNTVTDEVQHKVMNFMPIMFTVFFLWFPSGLVLYYTISNIITIIQQKLIYRSLKKQGLYIDNIT
ncbi:membrane protein insertase YidC [Candidatus Ishikawella capsulata]|uniref:Membrane protein insertase YidC n=1 Tax=Candidatus Ishikawaella capsulata Mpkobe TaxID=476281 RepID=C5WC28_9ENTR|nr:membrane protein insertase YidC [Candidatus Ishikawaella capsulata]BAH82884.1 inner membrane protein translocase component [Candidatus Ishikawaella capsulata Mpkobe]